MAEGEKTVIDIFYRVRGSKEFMHPRVVVTTAPDAERGQHMIETLSAALPAEGDVSPAGGRPSRRRGTVAQLIARRDAVRHRAAVPPVRLVSSQP